MRTVYGSRARRSTPAAPWLGWQALTLLSTSLVLVWLRETFPRFVYAGDKQNQYLPVMQDIGRRLQAGEFLPIIDPALGQSGNYALDLQYGLFEPTHWLVAIGLSHVQDVTLAAWLWSSCYQLVLAAGVCALTLRLGGRGSWCAAAGVAAALSGYVVFWLVPSWMPGLTSLAWIPWWWWAVVAHRWRGLHMVGVGTFTYVACAGGWPATWLIWICVFLGLAAETWTRRATLRPAERVAPLLASAGGGVAALISIVPLQRAVEFTTRATELENHGFLVPNLSDVLAFASPGLHGDIISFSGYSVSVPYFFGVWFALVVAWLVPWRREVLQRPGVMTCLVGLGLVLVLTQAASVMGPLRWPVRVLPGVHLFLAVLVPSVVGRDRLRVTWRRVAGALASLAVVGALTFFRRPDTDEWWRATIWLGLAMAAVLTAARLARGRLAGLTMVVATLLLSGWAINEHHHGGMTDRGYPPRPQQGEMVLDAQPTLTLFPHRPSGSWYAQGVAIGFARLSGEERVQPGYSSVGQSGFEEHFCLGTAHGYTCPRSAAQLFEVEPRTGRTWADLLGYREVVLHDARHLDRWQQAVGSHAGEWTQTARTDDFVRFSRTRPPQSVGRVTAVVGAADVEVRRVSHATQSYQVSSDGGATLVFRDLYWPGYVATLDGEPLPVEPLADTLVSVQVPAGAEGLLRVEYDPLPTTTWAALAGAGAGLVLLAVAVAWRLPRRRSAHPIPVPAVGEDEVAHGEEVDGRRDRLRHQEGDLDPEGRVRE